MFIQNKYYKFYFTIITRAKSRASTRKIAKQLVGYVERHHIIPKSLGGENINENLVFLTAKEHYICHRFLTKITTGKAFHQMNKAIDCMTLSTAFHTRYVPSARIYERLKLAAAKAISVLTKGKSKHSVESKKKLSDKAKDRASPNKGKPMAEDQKIKLSIAKKGTHQSPETIAKQAASRTGQKRTDETKAKMSAANKRHMLGNHHSDETKAKMSAANKGKSATWLKGKPAHNKGVPMSDTAKLNMSAGHQNREKLTCPHCGVTRAKCAYVRSHGDKCKSAP